MRVVCVNLGNSHVMHVTFGFYSNRAICLKVDV